MTADADSHREPRDTDLVILCDFDDTAADRNVATLLLDRFQPPLPRGSSPHWRDLHRQYLNAEITLAEYQENAFSRLNAGREEQAAYAKEHAAFREGFRELAAYCSANAIELAIVSHGLDFYIEALLENAELTGLPYFAVRTGEREGQPTFEYDFAREDCPWSPGNCKCHVLEGYQQRGHRVLYVGDGLSDTCPARRADFVFARDGLLSFCKAQGLPHREFDDFHAVLDYLAERGPEAAQ